jgi:Prophage endopeptidase tail
MYKVTITNDSVETVIHSQHVDGIKLPSGVIKKEINLIDSFNFSFFMDNPGYNKIKPLKTLISVFNMKTRVYEFEGRILGPSHNMESSGLHSSAYECEGELGYLHDSVQRHFEFQGEITELLTEILTYHNSQVEDYKKFEVGQVTVTSNLHLYLSAEKDTFQTIKEILIDNLGSELQIRKVNGVRFLDLFERIGEEKNTEIKIAKNLVSMSCDVDPTQIVTRLTPLGTSIKNDSKEVPETRITIDSVNNGITYVDDAVLINEFGIQGKSMIFDDVTDPRELLNKGKEWLVSQKVAHVQYKINALDLSLIGLDIDSFVPGNTYLIINPIMGINERLRVIGKSLDINSPQGASLTIGDKLKTLNQYQNDLNKSSQKVNELQQSVSNYGTTIGDNSTSITKIEDDLKALIERVIALEKGGA